MHIQTCGLSELLFKCLQWVDEKMFPSLPPPTPLSSLMDLYRAWAWTCCNLVRVKSRRRYVARNTLSVPLPTSPFLKYQWFSVSTCFQKTKSSGSAPLTRKRSEKMKRTSAIAHGSSVLHHVKLLPWNTWLEWMKSKKCDVCFRELLIQHSVHFTDLTVVSVTRGSMGFSVWSETAVHNSYLCEWDTHIS